MTSRFQKWKVSCRSRKSGASKFVCYSGGSWRGRLEAGNKLMTRNGVDVPRFSHHRFLRTVKSKSFNLYRRLQVYRLIYQSLAVLDYHRSHGEVTEEKGDEEA